MRIWIVALLGLGGCWFTPCGGGGPYTCEDPWPLEVGEHEVYDFGDCTGRDAEQHCMQDMQLAVEEDEVVLVFTDVDGRTWEAAWRRPAVRVD